MIDCNTNILELIRDHPEQVRSALGIGDDDNYMILQPTEGEYAEMDCIFTGNQLDDYEGRITVYLIMGIGYEPSIPVLVDSLGDEITSGLIHADEENNIYSYDIKRFACDINSGIFARTQKKRYWVNAYVCEEGINLGSVVGAQFVEHGDNIMLRAYPNESDYTVTWTDTSDPESPVIIENNALVHTINNIDRNYSIETCFVAPPPKYTFRVFTNDGKIGNLNLDRMRDGYKLGDVKVSFVVDGQPVNVNTTECDYGKIRTYDYDTREYGWIDNSLQNEHNLDRGVIIYNMPNNQIFTVRSTCYSDVCCYEDGCSDTVTYTTFKGFYTSVTENNYNDLGTCDLTYPTFEWRQYGYDTPDIDATFIHQMNNLPEPATCCDYFFVKIPGLQQGAYEYYYRNIVNENIYLNTTECYGQAQTTDNLIIIGSHTLTSNVTYYAVFEPKTSDLTIENVTNNKKASVSIEDYCSCTNETYVAIPCSHAINPTAYHSIQSANGEEYITVNNTCYQLTNYRETGAYALTDFEDVTLKEIIGSKIGILSTAEISGSFSEQFNWIVLQDEEITNIFNAESMCDETPYNECENFTFYMCEDNLTIQLK